MCCILFFLLSKCMKCTCKATICARNINKTECSRNYFLYKQTKLISCLFPLSIVTQLILLSVVDSFVYIKREGERKKSDRIKRITGY